MLCPVFAQEVGLLAGQVAPVAACRVANSLVPVISLAVVGQQLGTLELAAASLATILFHMSTKVGRPGRR